jgi:arginase family enzyme
VVGSREAAGIALQAAGRAMNQFGLLWVDSTISTDELVRVLGRGPRLDHADELALENIVLIGVREIEPGALELIRRYHIKTYTMEDVSLLPMREIVRRAISRCASGTEGIYVKFAGRAADDGNDGLTNREAHLTMELISASGALRVLEMNEEESEDLDSAYTRSSRQASANMPRFLLSALGKRILGSP